MTSLVVFFLLLSFIFQLSQASPVNLYQRHDTVTLSSATTLVVTATTEDFPVVTFYPSRVSDTSFWTLTTPTTVSETQLIGPNGYAWAAPTNLPFEPPEIPLGVPYPVPITPSPSGYPPFIPTEIPPEPTEDPLPPPPEYIPPEETPGYDPPPPAEPTDIPPEETEFLPPPPPESSGVPPEETPSYIPPPPPSEPTDIPPEESDYNPHPPPPESSVVPPGETPGYPVPPSPEPTDVPPEETDYSPPPPPPGSSSAPPGETPGYPTPSPEPTDVPPEETDYIPLPPPESSSVPPGETPGDPTPSLPEPTNPPPEDTSHYSSPPPPDSSSIPPWETSNSIPPSPTASSDTLTEPTPTYTDPTGTTNPADSTGTTLSTDPAGSNPPTDPVGSSTNPNNPSGSYTGSWDSAPTEPTESFPTYEAPTTTIPESAATSEAVEISDLFWAVYVNRDQITDSELKDEYIEQIKKTRDETWDLFNSLDKKPDPDPVCSNTKRKRSLISGITDLVGDVAKLISCATQVLDNLVDTIIVPVPPISVIETLTDTLKDISEQLKDNENDDNPTESGSETEASSTTDEPTTTATCTSGTAVPHCTETVSLSTSGSAVETITTTECITVTDCEVTATTATTTETASSSPTASFVCSPDCEACGSSTKRDSFLEARSPGDPRFVEPIEIYDGADDYVDWHVKGAEAKELQHRQQGSGSSALSAEWSDDKDFLYVRALVGCTSVVIVSEAGVWFSHHWEVPAFEGTDEVFTRMVLDPIKNGDTATGMESAFSLGAEGEILNRANNVQIFISTPKSRETGELLFESKVGEIEALLTGKGAPWEGITPIRRGYLKPRSDQEAESFAMRANSKVLIEYAKSYQPTDTYGDPIEGAPAGPIYRVWLEKEFHEHKWGASCPNTGNQRRQDGDPCNSAPESSPTAGPTTDENGSTITNDPTGTATTTTEAGPGDTITAPPTQSTDPPLPTSSIRCYPFQKPSEGPDSQGCHCIGFEEDFPMLPSSSGSDYDPCGYTTIPTRITTAPPAFTTTESNGEVVSCASSTYFNYAVNHDAECAGETQVVSTVASIASEYAEVSSSSAAEASWSSAAAVPSAGCYILEDSGFGDSLFEIYGINDWAGEDGSSLFDEEDGCGAISGFEFDTDTEDEFEGRMRDTQRAVFGLSFFKGGCVERAVHSAGGPEPGGEEGQISCEHAPLEDDYYYY